MGQSSQTLDRTNSHRDRLRRPRPRLVLGSSGGRRPQQVNKLWIEPAFFTTLYQTGFAAVYYSTNRLLGDFIKSDLGKVYIAISYSDAHWVRFHKWLTPSKYMCPDYPIIMACPLTCLYCMWPNVNKPKSGSREKRVQRESLRDRVTE